MQISVVAFTVLLASLVVIVALRRLAAQMPSLANLRGQPILTDNEREFFHRLSEALPQYHVFPQVAFSALLTTGRGISGRDKYRLRNRFDRKYADFVLCKRTSLEVVAIVELDDRTHDPEKDRHRDMLLKAAGYRIERFQSRSKPSVSRITEIFS